MTLDLFTEQTEKDSFEHVHKLIYGWPKSGKTTFAACMNKGEKQPLFIMTERGLSGAQSKLNQTFKQAMVASWPQFLATMKQVFQNKEAVKQAHSCLVFDTIGDLYAMCSDFICKENDAEHPEEIGKFGKGYSFINKEFKARFGVIMSEFPCTFIAHAAEKRFTVRGVERILQAPDIGKGGLEFLSAKCNLIAFMAAGEGDSGKSHLVCSSEGHTCLAGSHYDFMSSTFPIHNNEFRQSVEAIKTHFNNNI